MLNLHAVSLCQELVYECYMYHDKLNEIWGTKTLSLKIREGGRGPLAPLVLPPM